VSVARAASRQRGTTIPVVSRRAMARRTLAVLAACIALVACSTETTRQAPAVKPSGFLGDYSRLQPGGPDRALLVYRAPDASLAGYDKVILDPVTVWRAPGAGDAVSRADLQRLADLLYGMLLTRLKTYYVMVQTPGPKTLRIRAGAHRSGAVVDHDGHHVPARSDQRDGRQGQTDGDRHAGLGRRGECRDPGARRRDRQGALRGRGSPRGGEDAHRIHRYMG